jgi:hypothetical protein
LNICLVGSLSTEALRELQNMLPELTQVTNSLKEASAHITSGEFDKLVVLCMNNLPWTMKEDNLNLLNMSRSKNTKLVIFAHQSAGIHLESSDWVEINNAEKLGLDTIVGRCKVPNPVEKYTEIDLFGHSENTSEPTSQEWKVNPNARKIGILGSLEDTSKAVPELILASLSYGTNVQLISSNTELVSRVRSLPVHGRLPDGGIVFNNSLWSIISDKSDIGQIEYAEIIIYDLGNDGNNVEELHQVWLLIDASTVSESDVESLEKVEDVKIIWINMNAYLLDKLSTLVKEHDLVLWKIPSELESKGKWENRFILNLVECPETLRTSYKECFKKIVKE